MLIGKVLAKHDPVGLVPTCGESEYDPEVVRVLEAILDSSTEDIFLPKLRSVFKYQFGQSAIALVTLNEWQSLAEELWSTWENYPKAEDSAIPEPE